MESQQCNKCSISKPIDAFVKSGKNSDGSIRYTRQCKECKNRRDREIRAGRESGRVTCEKPYFHMHEGSLIYDCVFDFSMHNSGLKECSKCLSTKPLSEYYTHYRRADGSANLMSICVSCNSKRNKEYYTKNLDNVRSKNREYHHRNKAKANTRSREYYWQNRTEIREKAKKFREENKEKIRAEKRNHYLANRDYYLEADRIYREKNPDKNVEYRAKNLDRLRERDRIRYVADKAGTRARNHIRRARKKQAFVSHITDEELKDRDGDYCSYCFTVSRSYHLDHVYPLSKGGLHSPENLVLSCSSCNLSKSSLDPLDFIARYNRSEGHRLPGPGVVRAIVLSSDEKTSHLVLKKERGNNGSTQ